MQPPTKIFGDRYRALSLLGRGGMGSVFRGEHVTLRTPIAIKLLDGRLAESDVARARFLREARSAASIESPNVVKILDHGVEGDTPYIVMELLRGRSLAERLREPPAPSPSELATLFEGIGRAMAKAHALGIVHRDLKPDNVFLAIDADGHTTPKVLDFGLAKQLDLDALGDDVATQTGAVMGTPHYMSPEQARGRKDLDARTDLWALTVMAYECLVGARPFVAPALGELLFLICVETPPVPSAHASVPEGFDAWFARGLARSIDDRFQTIEQWLEALLDVLAKPMVPQSSSPSSPRPATHDAIGSTTPVVTQAPPGLAPTVPAPAALVSAEQSDEKAQQPSPTASTTSTASASRVISPRRPASRAVAPIAVGLLAAGGLAAVFVARGGPPTNAASSASERASIDGRAALEREGWTMQGGGKQHYSLRLDTTHPRDGHPGWLLAPISDPGGLYGTWVRTIRAEPYRGRRVRLSAHTRTEGTVRKAELWIRVQAADSPDDGTGVSGHWLRLPEQSEWTAREAVVDVPEVADRIEYGIGILGPGRMWLDAPTLEIVPGDTMLTARVGAKTVGGWTLTGQRPSTRGFELSDADTVHVSEGKWSDAPQLAVVAENEAPPNVKRVEVTFEVRTRNNARAPTCFLQALPARYAEASLESGSKGISATTEGYVKCALALDASPRARWYRWGVQGIDVGEAWLRAGEFQAK